MIGSVIGSLAAGAILALAVPTGAMPAERHEAILKRFADDFRSDPTARDGKFGFEIDGKLWHVVVKTEKDRSATVELHRGFPQDPIFYFQMDGETLGRLDRGMTGETATARAHADDPYPLRTRVSDGFPRYLINEEFNRSVERLRLHFFARGLPEIIPLSVEHSRVSHDVQVIGLVYRPGLRTVWVSLLPGQHANADPADQANPFDTMFIGIRGQCSARVGGVEVKLRANHAILIPAEAPHEFWNKGSAPCEGLLVMYGDAA